MKTFKITEEMVIPGEPRKLTKSDRIVEIEAIFFTYQNGEMGKIPVNPKHPYYSPQGLLNSYLCNKSLDIKDCNNPGVYRLYRGKDEFELVKTLTVI